MARILIVEDEENQRELYAEELMESGYDIAVAADGKEAIGLVNHNTFDLIILDIRMPEMDGIETLGSIININKKPRVIIYTAYTNYKRNYLTWTADAYLTKSTDTGELKSKIEELLAAA